MLFAVMKLCLSALLISVTVLVGMCCAYICKEIKEDLKIR